MHFALVSEYESEFKNMLKKMSNNDDEYKKLMERCNHKIVGTEDSMYQIDTVGSLRFKNQIYVPNHSNLKQIIFR